MVEFAPSNKIFLFRCIRGQPQHSFTVAPDQTRIVGRGAKVMDGLPVDADVLLQHPAVSRRHIRITNDGESCFVDYLNARGTVYFSRNSTWQALNPQGSVRLEVGDILRLNQFQFQVEETDEAIPERTVGRAMTEAEWLNGTDPKPMLEFLRDKASARKRQLFVCAACRNHWPQLEAECLRHAVEISERYADGIVSGRELAEAGNMAWAIVRSLPRTAPAYRVSWAAAWSTAPTNRYFAENSSAYLLSDTGGVIQRLIGVLGIATAKRERLSQVRLLFDIFGNPFHSIALDPTFLTWHDGTISKLALAIYEDRAFHHMPILADALEEAGCTDTTLLGHCRRLSEHVRGCWVVDLLLEKS